MWALTDHLSDAASSLRKDMVSSIKYKSEHLNVIEADTQALGYITAAIYISAAIRDTLDQTIEKEQAPK